MALLRHHYFIYHAAMPMLMYYAMMPSLFCRPDAR